MERGTYKMYTRANQQEYTRQSFSFSLLHEILDSEVVFHAVQSSQHFCTQLHSMSNSHSFPSRRGRRVRRYAKSLASYHPDETLQWCSMIHVAYTGHYHPLPNYDLNVPTTVLLRSRNQIEWASTPESNCHEVHSLVVVFLLFVFCFVFWCVFFFCFFFWGGGKNIFRGVRRPYHL